MRARRCSWSTASNGSASAPVRWLPHGTSRRSPGPMPRPGPGSRASTDASATRRRSNARSVADAEPRLRGLLLVAARSAALVLAALGQLVVERGPILGGEELHGCAAL